MTVNISKPALNLREKLAELDKPSGIAGEALLRADSVQEQRDLIGAGRKNLIINGRGFIDQRGLSGVSLNGGDYSLDRWYLSGGGTVFTQLTGGGFKVARTASNTWTRIGQKIEDCYNTIGTKQFTVSFDIKWNVHSGNENSMVYFRWLQADGTETGTTSSADIDKVGVNGWEKFSATLTLPDDATNPKHLMMLIYGSRDTAAPWEFELDNVQLELGSVATEFEHRSYGEELALCQRYYQTVGGDSVNQVICLMQAYSSTSLNGGVISFATKMRSVPTFSCPNITNFWIQGATAGALVPATLFQSGSEASTMGGSVRGSVSSGLTAGSASQLFAKNTNARLIWDAEL